MKITGKQDQVKMDSSRRKPQDKGSGIPYHITWSPRALIKGKTVPVCSLLVWDMQATLVHRRISEEAH